MIAVKENTRRRQQSPKLKAEGGEERARSLFGVRIGGSCPRKGDSRRKPAHFSCILSKVKRVHSILFQHVIYDINSAYKRSNATIFGLINQRN